MVHPSTRFEDCRELGQTTYEGRRDVLDIFAFGNPNTFHAPGHLLERQPDLQARERCAEAEMGAESE